MTLQTFVVSHSSLEDFITFWRVQYKYSFDDLYNKNIGLNKLEPENLKELFLWKNGMKLSTNKEIGFNKIAQHINIINDLKQNGFARDVFEKCFGEVSSIWKIFLMHIIRPEEFPIFDQHVYRAYRFINELPVESLPENRIEKTEIYFDQYRPFYQQLKGANGFSCKVIDEALWAYGKFLSIYPKLG